MTNLGTLRLTTTKVSSAECAEPHKHGVNVSNSWPSTKCEETAALLNKVGPLSFVGNFNRPTNLLHDRQTLNLSPNLNNGHPYTG